MILKTVLTTASLCLFALATADGQVIINEWNAVSGSSTLSGSDSFFGTIDGNGGNWIELAVVGAGPGSTIDLRNWQLRWGEDEDGDGFYSAAESGVINFTNDAFWSAIESGTIITIIETTDGDGSGLDTSTATSLDASAGDFHINISTLEEIGSSNPLLIADSGDNVEVNDGEFSVGNDAWYGELLDASGNSVFGPVGEGEISWMGGGVSGSEVGKLEGPVSGALADWLAIDAASPFFDDGDNSTFGSANTFGDSIQDFSALRTTAAFLLGDVDLNGVLDFQDISPFIQLLSSGQFQLEADTDGNGIVDFLDIGPFIDILSGQ